MVLTLFILCYILRAYTVLFVCMCKRLVACVSLRDFTILCTSLFLYLQVKRKVETTDLANKDNVYYANTKYFTCSKLIRRCETHTACEHFYYRICLYNFQEKDKSQVGGYISLVVIIQSTFLNRPYVMPIRLKVSFNYRQLIYWRDILRETYSFIYDRSQQNIFP